LKKDWKSDVTLTQLFITIKCLLIVPNPESALNEEAGKLLLEDYEAYCKTATLYTSIHASKHKVEFSQDKPSSGGILTPSKGNVSPKKRSGEESTAPIKKTTKDKKNLKRL
jgi:ubiquitin-conjugating enzyme E2 S